MRKARACSWKSKMNAVAFSQGQGGRVPGFGDRRGSDRSGLGLGLSIARQAVREHEGEIRTRNLVGQGCIFIIEVPLAAEDVCDPSR
jgi:signal transduction histidine kinase